MPSAVNVCGVAAGRGAAGFCAAAFDGCAQTSANAVVSNNDKRVKNLMNIFV
jgi:hypothetical protein